MKLKSTVYAPILYGSILILAGIATVLSGIIERVSVDVFLSSMALQLIVFLLPLAFYCRLTGLNVASGLNFRQVSVRHVPFLINMALIFFVGSMIFRYAGIFLFGETMVKTPDAIHFSVRSENSFLHFLGIVVLPALLEEATFRGILLKEYRSYGSAWSVATTAILFAMLHLSLENFVYYLFMGAILGVMTVASNSILPAMMMHVLINVAHEYFRPAVVEYLRQAGKSLFLPYLLLSLFIGLFVFMFSGLEKIYQTKAFDEILQNRKELLKKELEKNRALQEEKIQETKAQEFFRVLREIYLSPTFLACIVLFAFLVSDVLKRG